MIRRTDLHGIEWLLLDFLSLAVADDQAFGLVDAHAEFGEVGRGGDAVARGGGWGRGEGRGSFDH